MPHTAPKYAALEAYARGRLSKPGTARVARHLTSCELCAKALVGIRRYEDLRRTVLEVPVPELSWERFEHALTESVPPALPRRSGRVFALLLPALAIAAAVLIGVLATREPSQPLAAAAIAPSANVEDAAVEGVISFILGSVEIEIGGLSQRAMVGQSIREGVQLHVAPGAEVHLSLPGDTGVIAESETDLEFTQLRAQNTVLGLKRGSVFQKVKTLGENENFSVRFGPYQALVRGTRFRVSHENQSSVAVFEGHVEVHEDGALIADLYAGQAWRTSAQATPTRHGVDRSLYGTLSDALAGAILTLPPLPGVARWIIDGTPVSASQTIALRVPPGPFSLVFEDTRGKRHTRQVRLGPEGSQLDETLVRDLMATHDEPRATLTTAQIEPVVRAGRDMFRRCYELGLKRDPELTGKFVLSIRVASDGHVSRAQLRATDGRPIPLDVEGCVHAAARGFRFPRPTGKGFVAFEVPLNLRAAR